MEELATRLKSRLCSLGRGAMAEGMPFKGGETRRHATWDSTCEERGSIEPRHASGKERSAVQQDDGLIPRPGRVGAQRLPIDRGGR
jgi:hypothetical protein